MIPWLVKMTRAKRPITDKDIGAKAKEIAQNLAIEPQHFKASSGWIDNFKRRHEIKKGVYRGAKRRKEGSEDGSLERVPSPQSLEDGQATAPFDWDEGRRGSFANSGNSLETSPSLSSEEDFRGESEVDHAFRVIHSWLERQPKGFASEAERNLLENLRRRVDDRMF